MSSIVAKEKTDHPLAGLCGAGIFLSRNGRIVYINRAGLALIGGVEMSPLIGRSLLEFLSHDAHAGSPDVERLKLDSDKRVYCGKGQLKRFDGSAIEVEVINPPCEDTEDIGSMVILRELSDSNRMGGMQDLRGQYLQLTTDALPALIAYLDNDMRYRYVNATYETWFGHSRDDIIGSEPCKLHGADYASMQPYAAKALKGESVSFENTIHSQGGRRHVMTIYTPDMADSGGVRGFSSIAIDMTAHKRVTPEVESVSGITYDMTERTKMEQEHTLLLTRERSARIQAETAARARDEFLAIVSHELRAPLNGIQSWAHILENYVKDATASPLAQRALAGIKTGISQQVRLIEDLLDVTRMMSGKLRLVKQPFTLLPVVQAAVESVRASAAAKHIGITCTYQITSEQIDGDSDRVQQVIWNLLSNAVKFTPQDGNIWLTAAGTGSQVLITVRDEGVGISTKFLPHLFDRFSQEDTSSTRGHSGLGLGLFLVRHLIELHGGSVKAESAGEGMGSTFSIYLPLRASRDKYIPATQTSEPGDSLTALPSLEGLHVLLIDDQEEARESLGFVLTNAGASVFSAASSKEVIDWLPSVVPDRLPDILICDIAMPVEDGYTVLRKLRAWEAASGVTPLHRMPALALTAFAQREDRIRALTAGFQMHMTKPVAPEELIVVIAMMTSRE